MQIGDPTPESPEALTLPLTVIQELMGADGKPEHDYDHNDHGRLDKHLHDSKGGHHHDWKNGVRGSAYTFSWGTVAGAALVTVSVIGIIVVAADDVTGIGVADDFLLGPLGAGIGEGLALTLG